MSWPEKGTRVKVLEGDGTDAGEGVFEGLADVWVAITADGDLLSATDATKKPKVAKGCRVVKFHENPKIRLDSGRVVYGCQVFWTPVKVTETVFTAKQQRRRK